MSESEGKYKKKKLGAWFPSATVIKANTSATSTNHESSIANSADSVGSSLGNGVGNSVTISLYYQYISPLWSESKKQDALSFVEKWGGELGIGGRLRIAREGINATISGNYEAVRSFNQKLQLFDSHFQSTDFKYIDNLPMDRAFKDLKVLPVKELVYYGISAEEELGPGGVHLLPSDYHKKLGEKDTVVIDVRNQYESAIGRFSKQLQANGAELLVPEMRKSTDFPQWISSESVRQKIAGKNVLMYCTGGVRCERASAYLKKECGEDIKEVYQLQGGIERYLQEFPDGGYWQGKNYVFDKREAIGVGCFEGVGGVIKKPNSASAPADADAPQNKKKKRKRESDAAASHNEEILGKCCACKAPWDRYIGKKKCSMCAVPVLLCERCCTNKVDKTPGNELLMRCELCVAENCTVPVSEVQITKNGTAPKWSNDYSGNFDEEAAAKVIAKTVCKWGGGHAQKKKEERQKQREDKKRQRLQQMPCKYGATCNRKDCWFSHTGQYPTDY